MASDPAPGSRAPVGRVSLLPWAPLRGSPGRCLSRRWGCLGGCLPRSGAYGRREQGVWAAALLWTLVLGCSGEKPAPDPCTDGVPNLRVTITFDPSTCPTAPKDLTAELRVYVDDLNSPAAARSGIHSGDTVELEVPATYYQVWVRTPGWEPDSGSGGGDSGDSPPPENWCRCLGSDEVRLFCDGPAAELEMELECTN